MAFRFAEVHIAGGQPSFNGEAHASFGLRVDDEHGTESGISGSWNWDGSCFEVRSDRHGFLPLYFHLDELTGRLTVSDSPIELLAAGVPADLDLESLAFFCRAGFLLGDRTLHRGIRRVPPGSVLRWHAGAMTITQEEQRFDCASPRSIEEAIDGWIECFRASMRRRQPTSGRFAMPLSGGRDSRMMLMELRRLGHDPEEVVSFGPGVRGENEDLRIAREIARRLELPHHVTRSNRSWLDVEQERHAWCGCEAIEHAWMIGLWQYVRSNHDCWYDGLGAGAMTRGELNSPDMLALLRADRIDEWCDAMYARTAAPPARWVDRITSAMGLDLPDKDSVVDSVRQELAPHVDAPNPLGRFSFCNWGRRSIALNPFGICRDGREVHTPFMDRDLVDWVASVPVEWTFSDDLQTTVSRRLYPELADLEFDRHLPVRSRKSGVRRRLGNWIEKTRFFSGPGKVFRDVAADAMRELRRDPGANRALALMTHLVLFHGLQDPDRARTLVAHASSTLEFNATTRRAVA